MGKKSVFYMRGVPVQVDGRQLGEVRGKFYYRRLFGSRHFLRTPGGISFLVSSLDAAEALGARVAVVLDVESGAVYRAPLGDIRRFGAPVDRGYGSQLCLTFDHWQVEGAGVETLAVAA